MKEALENYSKSNLTYIVNYSFCKYYCYRTKFHNLSL